MSGLENAEFFDDVPDGEGGILSFEACGGDKNDRTSRRRINHKDTKGTTSESVF
jgi:hypothetical protein